MAISRAKLCIFALAVALSAAFAMAGCSNNGDKPLRKSIVLPWAEIDSGHEDDVLSLGYINNGGGLASAGGDVRTWSVFNGRLSDVYSSPSKTYRIATGRTNIIAICKGSKAISILDSDKKEPVRELVQPADTKTLTIALSDDTRTLASGDFEGDIIVWSVNTGKQIRTWRAHGGKPIAALALTSDGTKLASGSIDGSIILWDARSGRMLRSLNGHTATISALAFSPADSNTLASGSIDKTVKIWNSSGGALTATCTGHGGPVTSVCFSESGKTIASGSEDKTAKLWFTDGRNETTFSCKSPIYSVAFNTRDSYTLATGRGDGKIQIWNVIGESDFSRDNQNDSRYVLQIYGNDIIKERQNND